MDLFDNPLTGLLHQLLVQICQVINFQFLLHILPLPLLQLLLQNGFHLIARSLQVHQLIQLLLQLQILVDFLVQIESEGIDFILQADLLVVFLDGVFGVDFRVLDFQSEQFVFLQRFVQHFPERVVGLFSSFDFLVELRDDLVVVAGLRGLVVLGLEGILAIGWNSF
jgi:hypothetical protein